MRIPKSISSLLLLGYIVSLLNPAKAQVRTGDADSTLIPYSRTTPKTILRLMPRGARSLFWGKFTPVKNTQLGVHIFSPKRKLKSTFEGRKTYLHFYEINLFQLSRGVFKKISHVALTWTLYDNGFDYEYKYASKLHWMWLNKEKKEVPIITFDYFTSDTEAGFPNGDGTFLVFDSTWKQGKAAGNSGFGWTGGAGSQWGYKLARDEQGQLIVLNHESSMEGSSDWSDFYDPEKKEFIKGTVTNYPRVQ
ncbi:hypothetical protein EON83_26380 [bacterium]|nr:MAG: hypothetical protein EON83_26380 [bacterium]